MAPTRPPPDELLYPSEDPAPAASNWHNKQVHLLVDALQRHFAARADAFVGSNIDLLYYDDNGESVRVAPDVLVALGVAPASERERDSYQVWKEGVPPAVIIEIADGARWGDVLSNAEPYATMGVVEYYLFDPNAWKDVAAHQPVSTCQWKGRQSRVRPWAWNW